MVLLALTGLVYAAAWVIGQLIGPPVVPVTAPGAEVVSSYTGHEGAAIGRALLAEGVAGLALAVVVLALGHAAWRHQASGLASVIEIAGLGAAGLSFIQCALGLLLARWAVRAADGSRAGVLFELANRADGAKMLLLAVVAVATIILARRPPLIPATLTFRTAAVFPGWTVWLSGALALALLVSGAGYLLLIPGLAAAAYLSLPLLLIWVTGAGLLLARANAAPSQPRPPILTG
jgi:hypothetical protein